MDLAYLRAHPQHLQTFLTHQRIRETPVGGGSIGQARRLTLEDGASVFAKSLADGQPVPAGFFEAEANGLRWLAEAGAVAVPEVLVQLPNLIALEWVESAAPSVTAAERFGRELAELHRAGAQRYGASWPGYIGLLPQDNSPGGAWAEWFATYRLLPYLRRSADRQALSPADVARVERLIGTIDALAPPVEAAPSRLHGDLWPGNLHLGVRPGVAGRSGRPRRAPGDRPGPARPVRRRPAPGPHPGRLPGTVAAGRGLAGAGTAASAAPAAGAHRDVRVGLPGSGRGGYRGGLAGVIGRRFRGTDDGS